MARRILRASTKKRESAWGVIDVTNVGVDTNIVLLAGTLNAATLAQRPFTIVRTHILITCKSDQQIATEEGNAGFGMMVVNDTAAALGVTAIPGPVSDAGSPWFVWQPLQWNFLFASGVGVQPENGTQYVVDSKAMRKVGIDQDIAMVFDNVDGAHGMQVSAVGRFLIKTH